MNLNFQECAWLIAIFFACQRWLPVVYEIVSVVAMFTYELIFKLIAKEHSVKYLTYIETRKKMNEEYKNRKQKLREAMKQDEEAAMKAKRTIGFHTNTIES